jgi:hypothetical protein
MLYFMSNARWSTASVFVISFCAASIAFIAARRTKTPPSEIDHIKVQAEKNNSGSGAVLEASVPQKIIQSIPEGGDLSRNWKQRSAQPKTPSSERDMAAILERLASRDPRLALSLAYAEGNLRLRKNLRNAVLRGWASASAQEASTWVSTLPSDDRPDAMQAVFTGAAGDPESMVRFADILFSEDPPSTKIYGPILMTVLNEAGAYEIAAHFAQEKGAAERRSWLSGVFYQWAAHQPEQARAAIDHMTDESTRNEAFGGLVSGWAEANPSTLASYALTLPAGVNQTEALRQALSQWAAKDLVGATEWIAHFEATPDLDVGIAAVATSANMIDGWPQIAQGLAENISQPELRANTLQQVARRWEEHSPGSVEHFIHATPNLRQEDRAALLEGLAPSDILLEKL